MDIPDKESTTEEVLKFIINLSKIGGEPTYIDISTRLHDVCLSFGSTATYTAWMSLLPGGREHMENVEVNRGITQTRNYYVGGGDQWHVSLGGYDHVVSNQDQQ